MHCAADVSLHLYSPNLDLPIATDEVPLGTWSTLEPELRGQYQRVHQVCKSSKGAEEGKWCRVADPPSRSAGHPMQLSRSNK